MSIKVKPHDPIVEAMARKLFGIEGVPRAEIKRMKSRAVGVVAEMVATLRKGIDDLMDTNRRLNGSVCELVRERDQAHREFAELARLCLPEAGNPSVNGDGVAVPLTDSPLVRAFAMAAVRYLESGPGNFHAASFTTAKDGQEYSLTIQREGGKTPAQRITELEEQVRVLQTEYVRQNPCTDPQDEIDELTRDLAELRRKVGEWAREIDNLGVYCPSLLEEMDREAGK